MKWWWRILTVVLLLGVAAALSAPFTVIGTRVLLQLVDRYTVLEIDDSRGSLAGELLVGRLALDTPGLFLSVEELSAELEPACLWRSALCFQRLQASVLDIRIKPGEEEGAQAPIQEARDQPLIEFPVPLETDHLELGTLRVAWTGGQWRNERTKLRAVVAGSRIQVSRAVLSRPVLELEVSEGEDTPVQRLELPRIDLPLELEVEDLQLLEPGWRMQGGAHVLESLSLGGRWRNTALHLEKLAIEDPQWGGVSLDSRLRFDGEWPLTVEGQVRVARPPVWPGLHGREFNIALDGSAGALTLELSGAGVPEVALEGELDLLDPILPLRLALRGAWQGQLPLTDIPEAPAELAGLQLISPLHASVAGSLVNQHFQLRALAAGYGYRELALILDGSHADGLVTLEEMLLSHDSGEGELRAAGTVNVVEGLTLALSLESPGIDLPELAAAGRGRLQGSLRLDAQVRDQDWQVFLSDVALSGDVDGLPARVNGYAGLGDGLLFRRSDLNAEVNGARLSLQFSAEQVRPGQFELEVDDLGRWQPAASGQLKLAGELEPAERRLRFTGNAQALSWGELQLERAQLDGAYRHDGEHDFSVNLAGDEAGWRDMQLATLRLAASGNQAAHSLALSSTGAIQGEIRLSGALSEGRWNGTLAPTLLETSRQSWRLADPVAIAAVLDPFSLTVQAHCWVGGQARICPGQASWEEKVSGSLAISGDMGFVDAFMPEGLSVDGEVDVRLEGSWSEEAGLVIDGRSQTRQVLVTRYFGEGESVSLGWERGEIDIRSDRSGLNLDWRIDREGRRVIAAQVRLPPEREGALSGTIELDQLQLASLSPFVPLLSELEGTLGGRLNLSGTVDDPRAHGDLRLTGGRLALVGNPTELENLKLDVEVQGDSAALRGSGLLGGGPLRLSGRVSSLPKWQLALSVQGEKHNVLYPPSTELLVSEELEITAAGGVLGITGELIVHEGVLEPEQLPEGSVAISADVVEVDIEGNVIREELPFDISMDIWVRVRDRLRVTGTLIDATLGGDLHLLQAPKRPLQIFGNLHARSGRLRAYQQVLQVKRGTLSFTGDPANPSLDVRAERQISGSNVVAGVQVQGSFDALTLEVYSVPAMPQGEAMSYLVRGRGLDSGAGEEGTALALSVASGALNQSTLVSELNSIPGINNVAFGAEGSADDTAATVSGYIGDRIYLSYGFGVYEPINVLTARLYLRPRLWLEVVSRLENSVDLYYSFDID